MCLKKFVQKYLKILRHFICYHYEKFLEILKMVIFSIFKIFDIFTTEFTGSLWHMPKLQWMQFCSETAPATTGGPSSTTTPTTLPCGARFTCQPSMLTCPGGMDAIVDVPADGPCDCDTYKCRMYRFYM